MFMRISFQKYDSRSTVSIGIGDIYAMQGENSVLQPIIILKNQKYILIRERLMEESTELF